MDISVIVLAGPHKTSLTLEHLGDEIVDESVLVVDSLGKEFFLVVSLVDILEDFHKEAIVLLQDRVFSGQLERHFAVEGVFHAGACKRFD